MNAADNFDRLFDAGHVAKGTKFRTTAQEERYETSQLRKIVPIGIMCGMEKVPSRRAQAFMRWMDVNGLKTKRVAITSGVPQSTLASFVQGVSQSLKGETEEKIASAYETTVDAIFAGATNSQSTRQPSQVRIIGRVGAHPDGLVDIAKEDQQDVVPPPPGPHQEAMAIEVTGLMLQPVGELGAVLYFGERLPSPRPEMIGDVCAVETDDGRVMVAKIRRGAEPSRYDLEPVLGPTIPNVQLRWAAEFLNHMRPAQAARSITRAKRSAA